MALDKGLEQTPDPNREFSALGIWMAAQFLGLNMSLLRDWDHSGRPELALPGNSEIALQSIHDIGDFLEIFKDTVDSQKREEISESLRTIRNIENGFEYRKEYHLPGIKYQTELFRTALYTKDITQAAKTLQSLGAQPDAAELVPQLKQEYQMISDLIESDQIPDTQQVYSDVCNLTSGLNFVRIGKCAKLLRQVEQYAANIDALTTLTKLQNKTWYIDQAKEMLPEIHKDILERVLTELDFRRDILMKRSHWEKIEEPINPELPPLAQIREAKKRLLLATGIPPEYVSAVISDPQKTSEAISLFKEALEAQLQGTEKSARNILSKVVLGRPTKEVNQLKENINGLQNDQKSFQKLMDVLPYILETDEVLRILEEQENSH